jgi:hypothetical protein
LKTKASEKAGAFFIRPTSENSALCLLLGRMTKNCNPSVSGVFIPLWQRGIKGDFKMMLIKSPLAPLSQRGG